MTSDNDREAIRRQTLLILEKFGKSLESVKLKEKDLKNNEKGFREETNGEVCERSFRDEIFKNAPLKEGDFLIAESKKW